VLSVISVTSLENTQSNLCLTGNVASWFKMALIQYCSAILFCFKHCLLMQIW